MPTWDLKQKIPEQVKTIVGASGFREHADRFVRHREELEQIIQLIFIETEEGQSKTLVNFTVNLGIYYRFIPLLSMPSSPQEAGKPVAQDFIPNEWECHLRTCLLRKKLNWVDNLGLFFRYQRDDPHKALWQISDEKTLEMAVQEFQNQFQRQALTWFEEFSDLGRAYAFIQNTPETSPYQGGTFGCGMSRSPVRKHFQHYFAQRLNHKNPLLSD